MFAHAAKTYEYHRTSCCSDFIANLPRDQAKILDDFSKLILTISTTCESKTRKKAFVIHFVCFSR